MSNELRTATLFFLHATRICILLVRALMVFILWFISHYLLCLHSSGARTSGRSRTSSLRKQGPHGSQRSADSALALSELTHSYSDTECRFVQTFSLLYLPERTWLVHTCPIKPRLHRSLSGVKQ